MKGWYTLIPILCLAYGVLIAIAVLDGQAIDRKMAEAVEKYERDHPLDHNQLAYNKMEKIMAEPGIRECAYFVSRKVGVREYLGIVCKERIRGVDIERIRHGRNVVSDDWYEHHIQPVAEELSREFYRKHGW